MRVLWLVLAWIPACYAPRVQPGAGDAPPARCRVEPQIEEHFDDGGLPGWNAVVQGVGPTFQVDGGDLLLRLGSGDVEQGRQIEMMRSGGLTLVGNRLSVEAPLAPNAGAADSALFVYQGENALVLYAGDGVLGAGITTTGEFVELATFPYSPDAHRYWALREQDGAVAYEFSSDGVAWSLLASTTPTFSLNGSTLVVGVYLYMSVAGRDPEEARFDDFVLCVPDMAP